MSRPYYILSLCGTSILTNDTEQDLRKAITKHSNARTEQEILAIDPDEHRLIRNHLVSAKEKIAAANVASAQKLSAELNGILSLYKGNIDGRKSDFHQLLCTDTWLGEEAAKLVQQWLKNRGFIAELCRQPDLRTVELAYFQSALSDLVRWCEDVVGGYRSSHHVVFNLTGGFKSIQGFMQTLAQFYADETVYIFEAGNELLRLPRLPLRMTADDTVRQHLAAFRRLSSRLKVTIEETVEIPETLRMLFDGDVTLSPWGDLVWAQTKKNIYAEKVFPVQGVTRLLVFGKDFEKSVGGLDSGRRIIVNERLDDLIRYLEERAAGNAKPHNPPSLDFKGLSGSPCRPSTHECDAWADQNAKRLFGHFDDRGCFVLDCLGEALH